MLSSVVPSVKIVGVDEITPGGNNDRNSTESSSSMMMKGMLIGITIEASESTIKQYRAGQYVNLSAPTISSIGHPFTINTTTTAVDSSSQSKVIREGEKEFLMVLEEDTTTTATLSTTTTTTNGDNNNNNNDDEESQKRTMMRIIFRVYGSFTRKLASSLLAATNSPDEENNGNKSSSSYKDDDNGYYDDEDEDDDNNTTKPPLPPIFLDGFHGITNRLSQVLQHDKFVMIAGGIGITPYLSLLHELVLHYDAAIRSSSEDNNGFDNDSKYMFEEEDSDDEDEYDANRRDIELHWICRDSYLIEYISKEYFEPIQDIATTTTTGANYYRRKATTTTKANIRITIHQTSSSASGDSNVNIESNGRTGIIKRTVPNDTTKDSSSSGTSTTTGPFVLSNFVTTMTGGGRGGGGTSRDGMSTAVPSSSSLSANLPMMILFTTSSVAGMTIFWYCYVEIQEKHAIFSRFVGIGVVTALIGGMTVMLYCCCGSRQSSSVNNNNMAAGMSSSLFNCCFNWWSIRKARQPVDYTQVELDDDNGINDAGTDDFHDEYGNGNSGLEMATMTTNGRNGNDGPPLAVNQRQRTIDPETTDASSNQQRSFVQIDVKKYYEDDEGDGRPNLNALIDESLFSGVGHRRPGILLCGPTSLTNDIADLVNQKQKCCFGWFNKSTSTHPISIYTDSFEM